MRTVLNITAILTLVGIFIGAYIHIEKKYALDKDLKAAEQSLNFNIRAVEKRLDIKINSDYLKEIQARIWTLEERIDKNPDDITAKEDLRRLKEGKKKHEEKLRALID